MRVVPSFYTRHFELPYRDQENRDIWIHLIHLDPVSDDQVGRLLDAFEVIIHQYGIHVPICIQATLGINIYGNAVDIEQTEDNVYLANPLSFIEFCSRNPVADTRIYLVTDIIYHQIRESFQPAHDRRLDQVLQETVRQHGLFYVLVE